MSTRDDRPSLKGPKSYNEQAPLSPGPAAQPEESRDFEAGPHYERWKKTDLYQRAKEMGIDGRSQMTKAELIATLRSRLRPH